MLTTMADLVVYFNRTYCTQIRTLIYL